MYCQHEFFNIYGVFSLPLAYEQGAEETGQTYRVCTECGIEPVPSSLAKAVGHPPCSLHTNYVIFLLLFIKMDAEKVNNLPCSHLKLE